MIEILVYVILSSEKSFFTFKLSCKMQMSCLVQIKVTILLLKKKKKKSL